MDSASEFAHQYRPAQKTHGFYDWLDMVIKVVTTVVGVVLAFDALAAYKKDVDEKVLEQRINAFDDAIKIAGQVAVARDWNTFGERLDEFGTVNHGQVLASLGEGDVYDAINSFYNSAVDIWNAPNRRSSPSPPEGALDDPLEKMARQFNAVLMLPGGKKPLR